MLRRVSYVWDIGLEFGTRMSRSNAGIPAPLPPGFGRSAAPRQPIPGVDPFLPLVTGSYRASQFAVRGRRDTHRDRFHTSRARFFGAMRRFQIWLRIGS